MDMERIIPIIVLVGVVIAAVFFIKDVSSLMQENQNEVEEFEKTVVKIDGEIIKTEQVEQGFREVTVKAIEGKNTVIIKFVVYKEDIFIGKAGEHFSGKISSKNIVSSEIVRPETEKEQN